VLEFVDHLEALVEKARGEGYRAGFTDGLATGKAFGHGNVMEINPEENAVISPRVESVVESVVDPLIRPAVKPVMKLPKPAIRTVAMVEPKEKPVVKLPKPAINSVVKPVVKPIKATGGVDPFKNLLEEAFGRK
jgi:hypothetical protein